MWDFLHQPNGWLRLTDGLDLHHGSGTQHLSTESKASAMRCDRHGPIHWREPHTLQVMLSWLPTVRLAATGLRKNLSSMPCVLADVSRILFASSLSNMGSDDFPLLGQPWLPTSWCFFVRLTTRR